MSSALILGITGQDGRLLSEFLLGKGYQVTGLVRRSSSDNLGRLKDIRNQLHLVSGDILDISSLYSVISDKPDEIYNLACQSDVGISFKQPNYTFDTVATGCLNVLECIKNVSPQSKYYFAASSEMFGSSVNENGFQNESTPFFPQSVYAIGKVAGFNMTKLYRKAYGLHTSSGILFNHESQYRGLNFVTRKISSYVARIKLNKEKCKLKLGNLDSMRDWGFAGDYVCAMWLMLQQEVPDDYVVATGETRSVRDFLIEAFKYIGISNWEDYVEICQDLFRPAEVNLLRGDASKTKEKLGWVPTIHFPQLVKLMVDHDIELGRNG
jgi:GDPmannose 4,6-dehydratase